MPEHTCASQGLFQSSMQQLTAPSILHWCCKFWRTGGLCVECHFRLCRSSNDIPPISYLQSFIS